MVAFGGVAEASVSVSRGGVVPCPFAYLSRMQSEVSRKERMNGTADVPGEGRHVHDGQENVVSVILACISCGRAEEIHVFRERGFRGGCIGTASTARRMGTASLRYASR